MPRGLRPPQDPRHRVLRSRHAGAAQGQEDLLRHEDPRQTKGWRRHKPKFIDVGFPFPVYAQGKRSTLMYQADLMPRSPAS